MITVDLTSIDTNVKKYISCSSCKKSLNQDENSNYTCLNCSGRQTLNKTIEKLFLKVK